MIFGDFETKSEADLKKVGVWEYARHPSTEIICFCFAIDDGPVQSWLPGQPVPRPLVEAFEAGHEFEAHNSQFEYAIWTFIAEPKHGFPHLDLERLRDSMAVACYYAMPAALDKLLRALHMPGKDPEGTRLISKYCKLHLKTAKRVIPSDDLAKFVRYCGTDVERERQVSNFLGDLPEEELGVFLRWHQSSQLGLYLDEEGILAAVEVVEKREAEIVGKFRALTGFNPTQRDKVLGWFHANGLYLENLQADHLEEALEDWDIPQGPARQALELRLSVNKASTKKLDAMLRNRGDDGIARYQTRYHGALTGRETGSGFQPLNLKRGIEKMDPEQLVRDIMYRDPAWLDLAYGDAMEAVANASRYWIAAPTGTRLMAGDFVSIEAVLLACLAGEEWKVEAFRRKEPIYEVTACKIHKLPPEALALAHRDKGAFKKQYGDERQDGKTCELAFGYQGALNAYLKFDSSGRHSDERIIGFCKDWRAEHPATTGMWRGLENACMEAVLRPGMETGYREVGFRIYDEWLAMIMPNGKRIWYFDPQVREGWPQWHQPAVKPECRDGTCTCKPRPQVTYMAVKNGKWKRVYTYGGKTTENAVQTAAREILEAAKKRVVKAGYSLIFSVYDEAVCRVPDGQGSLAEFKEILLGPLPAWAEGWPIDVDVWEGRRYRK